MKEIDSLKLNSILRARLEEGLDRAYYAGVQLAVLQHGETVCRFSMGTSDCRTGAPLPDQCMFRLASMTKAITCTAALLAVQKGWFSLTDRLADHMPEFENMMIGELRDGVPTAVQPAKNPILIYQLMTHVSGVFNSSPLSAAMVEAMPREAYRDVSTVAAYCSKQPLVFEPGTRTAYTGSASFDIVAALIERKSGMKFSDFVRKELLDPLGLDDLTYTPTEDQWARLITMHDRADSKTPVAVDLGRHVYEGFPLTYTRAGGGSMGSLDAYCRFAEFLRRGGEVDGVRLLSPELCSKLSTPWIPDGIPGRNPTESWGLGVRVIVHDAHLPIGSFGWSGAYGTHFWIDPENEITAVFMKNSFHYDAGGGGRSGVQFESDVMACLKNT